jgi:formyltetrahydrofolate deformylase
MGAARHSVTEDLDEGPIIEQDGTRVSHRDQVADSLPKGRAWERIAPSQAIRWQRNHRILVYGKKTVVFN